MNLSVSMAALVASGLLGVAVLWASYEVLAILLLRPPDNASWPSTESGRRRRLREQSSSFRWFEPLIVELGKTRAQRSPEVAEAVARNLVTSACPQPWTSGEFLAARRIEAVLAGLLGAAFWTYLLESWVLGVVLGGLVAICYERLAMKALSQRAVRRLRSIQSRMPYTIDVMALMMEVGANFQEAMSVIVAEDSGTPVAEELGEVLRQHALGRTRRQALESLAERLPDEDVKDLVTAVNKGQELGTPLSQSLRTQAQRMFTKRSLRIEKASQEAQVLIVMPGMIIMVACLLIVVAPFILGAMGVR